MKHKVSIKAFDIGDELQELYWFAGTIFNERSDCFIRPVLRGYDSGKFKMCHLPIGNLPYLSLGRYFDHGQLLDFTVRGVIESVVIDDLSICDEITSADIPHNLYSFNDRSAGNQKLLRYKVDGNEIFIPTIELIRYLFLHNKTLANAIMRTNGLISLHRPQLPGFQQELKIDFTSDMPSSSLTNQFAQEFAWIAMDSDTRASWDSVMDMSLGETYLTLKPPSLISSQCQFRCVRYGCSVLVLEIIHMTGKTLPCEKLIYSHPMMKQPIRVDRDNDYPIKGGNGETKASSEAIERYEYDFELNDDGEGATNQQSQKVLEMAMKKSSFERRITIERALIPDERNSSIAEKKESVSKSVKKTVKVSAGDISLTSELPPIEFGVLVPGLPEEAGDLDIFEDVVKHMSVLLPNCQFAMALCQLKPGRIFSSTNRHARLAVVVTIYQNTKPPIYLLDVDHSGSIALSLMALSFKVNQSFEKLEPLVKEVLDGLIDNGGHWNTEVESHLESYCRFDRFPKLITPRDSEEKAKAALWATRLADRLGLLNI